MSGQIVVRGQVFGFVINQPDLVRVTDGFFNVVAIVTATPNRVQIGQQYTLYKQNGLYYLGAEIKR